MDLRELAERFGEKLTFFGGICNQKVLPFGTPEEIDANVEEVTRILGARGRYVIAPSNGIGADVPPENVEAFCRAAERCRSLKL